MWIIQCGAIAADGMVTKFQKVTSWNVC